MHTDSPLPRITQSDLLQRTAAFTDEIVREMQGFNETYKFPSDLTETERRKIKDAGEAAYPTPQDMRSCFEEIFMSYMKDRYVIIQDV